MAIVFDCRRRGHDISPEHTLREAYELCVKLDDKATVLCRCHTFEFDKTANIEEIVSEYFWRANDFERA